MTAELQASQTSLYDTDFLQWLETTAAQLRNCDYTQLDWENLIAEIEDMSKRERQSLKSNLVLTSPLAKAEGILNCCYRVQLKLHSVAF